MTREAHAKLWELAKDPSLADFFLVVNDSTLLQTKVAVTVVPRCSTLPHYVCQARHFQQYVGSLASEDGLPLVQAIAFD